jgi:hypothetical protein
MILKHGDRIAKCLLFQARMIQVYNIRSVYVYKCIYSVYIYHYTYTRIIYIYYKNVILILQNRSGSKWHDASYRSYLDNVQHRFQKIKPIKRYWRFKLRECVVLLSGNSTS